VEEIILGVQQIFFDKAFQIEVMGKQITFVQKSSHGGGGPPDKGGQQSAKRPQQHRNDRHDVKNQEALRQEVELPNKELDQDLVEEDP
jgi:hypothetical protein